MTEVVMTAWICTGCKTMMFFEEGRMSEGTVHQICPIEPKGKFIPYIEPKPKQEQQCKIRQIDFPYKPIAFDLIDENAIASKIKTPNHETDIWKIQRTHDGLVLSKSGEWIEEPGPGKRTDEFLNATRFNGLNNMLHFWETYKNNRVSDLKRRIEK